MRDKITDGLRLVNDEEKLNDLPIHYRYDDYISEDGIEVRVRRLYPVRETPCFYMVIDHWSMLIQKRNPDRIPKTRRVSKDSMRRFCYPTKKEALHSYKKRKLSQIGHAEFAMVKAKSAYGAIKDLTEDFDVIDCGRPDYWDSLNFD